MNQRKTRQLQSPHPPMEVEDRVRRLLTKEKLKMVGGIAGEIRSGEFRFWVKDISEFVSILLVGKLYANENGTGFNFRLRPKPKVIVFLVLGFAVGIALELYFAVNQGQFAVFFFIGGFLIPILIVGLMLKASAPLLRFIKELALAIDAPLPTERK